MRHLALSTLMLLSTLSFAGTYTLESVSVTHSGGWPSAMFPRPVIGGWASEGGQLPGVYKDGYYLLTSTIAMQSYTSVSSLSPLIATIDRNDISVRYHIKFTASFPGDTPATAYGLADTRYALHAHANVNAGYTSNMASAGIENGPGPSFGWMDCWAYQVGAGVSIVDYPTPSGTFENYKREGIAFDAWVLVSPGVWETSGEVNYISGVQEYDLKVEHHGSSEVYRNEGITWGRWEFRLKQVTAGGSTVISQPGFW